MNDDSMIFVLLIIGISTAGWVINNYIRAKHGYEPHDRHPLGRFGSRRRLRGYAGAQDEVETDRKVQLLSAENERLTGQISRLEERIAVLERIATDPAERTAREIDALR
jgi:hypothetical protein